jgi:hypothetical protein
MIVASFTFAQRVADRQWRNVMGKKRGARLLVDAR